MEIVFNFCGFLGFCLRTSFGSDGDNHWNQDVGEEDRLYKEDGLGNNLIFFSSLPKKIRLLVGEKDRYDKQITKKYLNMLKCFNFFGLK